jgi:hypothetical protein
VIIFHAQKSIKDKEGFRKVLIANILLAVALSLLFILLTISVIALLVAFANHVLFLLLSGAATLNTFKLNPALRKWLLSDAGILQEPKPAEKVAP